MKLEAVLALSIMDTSISGHLFVAEHDGSYASLLKVRGQKSPLFSGEDFESVYRSGRDWFGGEFDGFVKVDKLKLEQGCRELQMFREVAGDFEELFF